MTTPAKILFVDDDRAMCEAMSSELEEHGYNVAWRKRAPEALQLLISEDFDVVITDLNMPEINGVELCRRIADARRDVPVIVITAFGSLETAIATIRAGAFDFLTKPIKIDEVVVAVERALRDRTLREQVRRLQSALDAPVRATELLGTSSVMQEISEMISRIGRTDVGVLITGESGTGKELVARAIHKAGDRPEGPFVAVNCGAIPETLFESELFGHAKGAFTDAKAQRKGLFSAADGGTLFLDEVGELPLAMQVKLLRALEERAVRPVGSNADVPYDAKIITATNRDLDAAVQDKTFREDLYYRINVVHLEVPPLRARGGDVLELAQHFVRSAAERQKKTVTGFSTAVAERLLAYTWPGNVRELVNTMERAVALTRLEQLSVEDLPPRIQGYKNSPLVITAEPDELVTLDELEKRYVARVLEAVGGNKSSAARVLGLDRTTLYRMLARFNLR